MIKSIILALLLTSISAHAYLIDRSTTGRLNKWNSSKDINFFLTTNISGMSTQDATNIVSASAAQFNSKISNNVNVVLSNDGAVGGRSDIYFSSDDPLLSDPGIVAVTTTAFDPETGRIIEADIILNDTYNFSGSILNKKYLGNAMTHEVGHALGLAHSQLVDATMYFETRRGQHKLHTDDISGIKYLYGSTTTSSINGKVAGSGNLINVFGAHVYAISLSTGKAVASSASDTDGSFSITNLPLDDTYFIYVESLNNISSLPAYYNVAKKNYCDSGNSYKGGFFQRCFGDDRGKPFGVRLSQSSNHVNIGNVSIKCGLEVPRNYTLAKGDEYTPNLVTEDINSMYVGSSSVGFFNSKTINGVLQFDDLYDDYNLDLSLHDIQAEFPGKSLYLEVKIMTQQFYSPLRVVTIVDHEDYITPTNTPGSAASLPTNSDGNYDLGITLRLPIYSNQLKNIYNLKVLPNNINELHNISNFSPLSNEIYSMGRSQFEEGRHFYFMTTRLVERVGIDYVEVSQKNYGEVSDNTNCMDGAQTYAVEANTVYDPGGLRVSKAKKDDSGLPLACGTIVDVNSGPPGNGPLASFTLLAILFILSPKYRLSHFIE